MADGAVHTSVDGAVGTLLMDNPSRRNAMTAAMYQAMPDAIDGLVADPNVRVIVLRGAGDEAFCAGSDVSEFSQRRTAGKAGSYENAEHAAWHALAYCELPAIAAIHGPCMGGGVALAIHCDLRFAADDATFATPPARLGIAYPAEAVQRLVALVGPAATKQMLFGAEKMDATAAAAQGLVESVQSKSELDEYVADVSASIAELAPLSIKAAKVAVDHFTYAAPDADAVRESARACYTSADYTEGLAAFTEKRPAVFKGS